MTKLKMIIAISGVALLAACSAQNTPDVKSHDHVAKTKTTASQGFATQKPGAAVQLSNDYNGKTAIAEMENITISIDDRYQSGTLSLNVKADDGLSLFTSSSRNVFSMQGDEPHTISIQAQAMQSGTYYIQVTGVAKLSSVQSMPVNYGFPIYVGNAQAPSKRDVFQRSIEAPSSGGVISMKADEKINQ